MTKRLLLLFALILLPLAALAGGQEHVLISEMMAANLLTPVDGQVQDWIELHNPGKEKVNLQGWGLSDRQALPFLAPLKGTIPPGGYLVLTQTQMGFALSRQGERVFLTSPEGKTQEVAYEELSQDAALMWSGKDYVTTYTPTPGDKNVLTQKDQAEQARYESAVQKGLVITEIMAANGDTGRGKPPWDWVEIYNPGTVQVNLDGLYLAQDGGNLKRWGFPMGARLRPGSRALIYCTGSPETVTGGNVYVNSLFKLEKSGGALVLSDGVDIIDSLSWDSQFGSVAYGRPEGQGSFRYLQESTPQKPNPLEGYTRRLPAVDFSRPGGYATKAFTLTLSGPSSAQIHYTLDGSEPGAHSPVYTQPLDIAQNTVVRAVALGEGAIDSPIATHTYLFDVPLPGYTLSLVGENATFFTSSGIFSPGNHNLSSEYRANAEVFFEGKPLVNQLAGVRLTGGTSLQYLPRTFSLYARPGYDASSFAFNPFTNRFYPDYQCLTFRGGGTDYARTRIRDDFLCNLSRGYGIMYLASAPASVYVNGAYWGCMSIRERANQDAIAQWEGISDKATIDQIIILKNRGIQIKGSRQELEALASFCRNQDLSVPENLQHVLSQLDVDSLFAHTAFQIITGNGDLSNLRYYKVPGGKWKLMLFDLDLAMLSTKLDPLPFYLGNGRQETKHFYGELFQGLMRVPEMREQFFTLVGRILHQRFMAQDVLSELDTWQQAYAPLMEVHGQSWRDQYYSKWEKSMADFRKVLVRRPVLIPKYFAQSYKLSDQEVEKYFGDFLRDNQPPEGM